MKEPSNLFEAVGTTQPGKHAHAIGDVIYDHAHKIPEDSIKQLRDVQHYLEQLAFDHLENMVPEWTKQLLSKRYAP